MTRGITTSRRRNNPVVAARAVGAQVAGPSAVGPVVIAVMAVGAVAIGRLAMANAVIRKLRAEEIEIGSLKGSARSRRPSLA